MPDAPWSITITPTPSSEVSTIRTSDGQEFTVRGLALFADGGEGHLFSFFWGSPAMAAAGFIRSFVETIRRGDLFAVAFYKRVLSGLVAATGSKDRQTVTAEDLLRRWDAEDVYNAMKDGGKSH